jgi:hypothetical protein
MKKRTIKDIKISRMAPQNNIIRSEEEIKQQQDSVKRVVKKRVAVKKMVNTRKIENIDIDMDNNINNIDADRKVKIERVVVENKNLNNIDESSKNIEKISKLKKKKGAGSKILIFILGLLGIFFLFNNFLNSADIDIEPKKEEVSLKNVAFNVNKITSDGKKTVGEFYYDIVEKKFESDKVELKIEAVKKVEEFASGKMKITNNTAKTMQLIKRTRFELDGKEYRIKNTISIPKKSSKTVLVVADKAGDDYNNLDKDQKYNIPGLKNNKEMYENIFGTSVTEMKGGFSGTKPVPNKDDLAAKKSKLVKEMDVKMRKEIVDISRSTKDIYFKSISQKKHDFEFINEDEKMYLVVKSLLVVPFVKKENFDEVIINKAIDGDYVEGILEDSKDFEYGFLDNSGDFDYISGDKFKVKINGNGNAV